MTAAAPQRVNFSDFISPTEELIEEARRGRMFILVDDEDRENEGDLVVPAQWATPEAINFMAKHARGLICLALTRERVEPEEEGLLRYVVEKGSIAVDGVSLTVSALDERGFEVSLIPETLERTTLGAAAPGAPVNLEVDVVAKYVEKLVAR